MGKLGYTEADYGDRVFHYNNDMWLPADWSFTIFMVDSQVDLTGNSRTASSPTPTWAAFHGTTYDNENHTIGTQRRGGPRGGAYFFTPGRVRAESG